MSGSADQAETFDVAIVGAGPAGANAALAVREAGLTVAVIDEAAHAGGQVFRAPVSNHAKAQPDGDDLRQELAQSGANLMFGHRVWLAEPGFALHTLSDTGNLTVKAQRLILANGTSERVIPFPGWTLPGVIGLAGATILLKAHATLPGKRTLIAGRGPLLAAVAASVLDQGGEVSAIADASNMTSWLKAAIALRHRLSDLQTGIRWRFKIQRAGVPWLSNSRILSVEQKEDALAVTLSGHNKPIICDAVAVGDGLIPAIETARLLNAEITYEEARGGWIPAIDLGLRCSVQGLYACGDGSGVFGAAVAALSGRLAGLTAALDQGAISAGMYENETKPLRSRLKNAKQAAGAMSGLMTPKPDAWDHIPGETTICRCEDVSRKDLETAITGGATEINQLKAWTRCGMGPCQGRMCGEAAARILAKAIKQDRSKIAPWTARAPLRPLPMADFLGEYDYDDIPVPKAAPL